MNTLRPIAESQNVPLWNGEFGPNNSEWVAGNSLIGYYHTLTLEKFLSGKFREEIVRVAFDK